MLNDYLHTIVKVFTTEDTTQRLATVNVTCYSLSSSPIDRIHSVNINNMKTIGVLSSSVGQKFTIYANHESSLSRNLQQIIENKLNSGKAKQFQQIQKMHGSKTDI